MDYEDFVVHLTTAADGGIEVRVVRSPGGQARSRFRLAADPSALSALPLNGEPASDRNLQLAPPFPSASTPEKVGEQLFQSLFSGPVRRRFDYSLGRVEEAGRGLRVQLKLDLPELSRLHAFPWELLYRADVREFLCLSPRTLLARYLDVPRPERPLLWSRPLRILAVLSDLSAPGYPPLDLDRERRYLTEAAHQAGVDLVFLEGASRPELAEALARERFHTLHFAGHGWFDTARGEGGLAFKTATGGAEEVGGRALAADLAAGSSSPQLVVLNACSTAQLSPQEAQSPFLGAAPALVLAGFPAILAMRTAVSDAAAIAFSRAFYRHLLIGDAVETALLQGRLAISRLVPSSAEWSVPVLFLRSQESLSTTRPAAPPAFQERSTFRYVFDRALPRLHGALTRRRLLAEPEEPPQLQRYMADRRAKLEQEIGQKTYLPLDTRPVPGTGLADDRPLTPFVRPIQGAVRQVLARDGDDNSANAQLLASRRWSWPVRSVVQILLSSRDPVVLLGDPGNGKTMTLQETALAIVRREARHVFPTVPIYLRLGDFHGPGRVGPEEVLDFVKRSVPETLRPWIDDLDRTGRLVLLFDGIDEMSRDRYNEHIEALSVFAGQRKGRTRTLFSCRIADFSLTFIHRRLVLLPFDRSQIAASLRRALPDPTLQIDGEILSRRQLARKLAAGGLPVDASNPFELWLLCLFLYRRQTWPVSRVQLMDYFQQENYTRKLRDAQAIGLELPPAQEAFHAWARFAFLTTERDRGTAVPFQILVEGAPAQPAARVLETIQAGKWCGVLAESVPEVERQIGFQHHRFQEYFTALWVHEQAWPIAWLDKLDAPRWQETMLNLALLGGAEDGVRALAAAIGDEVDVLQQWLAQLPSRRGMKEYIAFLKRPIRFSEAGLSYDREALLADRTELGARLIDGAPGSPAVREALRPSLRRALDLLVERGRPVSQVKMMRACHHLDDADLLGALDHLLDSPIRWVSDQALILVSSAKAGRGLGQVDLASSMALYLMVQGFLPRWPVFARAIGSAGTRQLKIRFLLTTLFALIDLGLLLGAAACLLAAFLSVLPPDSPRMEIPIPPLWLAVPQAIVSLATTGVALWLSRTDLWKWVLYSVPVGISSIYTCLFLWHGNLSAVLLPLLGLGFSWLASPLMAACGLVLHLVVASLYLAVNRGLGHPLPGSLAMAAFKHSRRHFVFHLGEFLALFRPAPLRFDSADLELLAAIVATALGCGAFALSYEAGLPLMPATGAAIGLVTLYGSMFLGLRVARQEEPERKARKYFWGLAGIGLALCLISGVIHLQEQQQRTLAKLLNYVGLFLLPVLFGGSLRYTALVRRTFPRNTFTPAEWKKKFVKASPWKQRRLLLSTVPESVGLQAKEFLALLVELERSVWFDPALSAYWDRRDQLEQAVRQERQG